MNSFYFYLRLVSSEFKKTSLNMMPIYLDSKRDMAIGCLGVSLTFVKLYAQLSLFATDNLLFINPRSFSSLKSQHGISELAKKNLEKLYNNFKLAFDPDISDQSINIYNYFEEVGDILDRDIPGSYKKYNLYLCKLARELAIDNYRLYKERYD